MWKLYSQGRVLSLPSEFCLRPLPIFITAVVDPVFIICVCMQMSGGKKPLSERWPSPIAIPGVAWTQAQVVNSSYTLAK